MAFCLPPPLIPTKTPPIHLPPPLTLAKKTTNESLDSLVAFHLPLLLDLDPNDHQRVITTCWWLSTFLRPQAWPKKTTNESRRLVGGVGGLLPPSAHESALLNLDLAQYDHQRVITTRWWLPTSLHPRIYPPKPRPCSKRPPTSHRDSLVASYLPPPSTPTKLDPHPSQVSFHSFLLYIHY